MAGGHMEQGPGLTQGTGCVGSMGSGLTAGSRLLPGMGGLGRAGGEEQPSGVPGDLGLYQSLVGTHKAGTSDPKSCASAAAC